VDNIHAEMGSGGGGGLERGKGGKHGRVKQVWRREE
jgi:hypothetical protein